MTLIEKKVGSWDSFDRASGIAADVAGRTAAPTSLQRRTYGVATELSSHSSACRRPKRCANISSKVLRRLEVDWSAGIEVSSIDLVETYVASGFGIGLSVLVPNGQLKPNSGQCVLPKTEFPPVIIGALWRGKPSALLAGVFGRITDFGPSGWFSAPA